MASFALISVEDVDDVNDVGDEARGARLRRDSRSCHGRDHVAETKGCGARSAKVNVSSTAMQLSLIIPVSSTNQI